MKKYAIIGFVFILIVAVAGFYLMTRNKPAKKTQTADDTQIADQVYPTIDPSVEVDLTPRADKHAVNLVVRKIPSDFSSIEYELTYETASGKMEGSLSGNPIQLKSEDHNEWKREILLGTCSKTCTYHQGVKEINLTVKFNSSTGASVFQKKYSIE